MKALLIPANPTQRVRTITLDPAHPEATLHTHLGDSLTSLCQHTHTTRLETWAGPDTTTPNTRANAVLDALAAPVRLPASLTGDVIVTSYTEDYETAGLSTPEARTLRKVTATHPHPAATSSHR